MAEGTPNVNGPGPGAESAAGAGATPAQMATSALESAAAAARKISHETNDGAQPVNLPEFGSSGSSAAVDGIGVDATGLGLLDDVTLRVKIELGRTQMYVEDVLRLNANAVVELDKAAGDPVDIYVNDRHVARGEVLVLNENFCVRVSEILSPVNADE